MKLRHLFAILFATFLAFQSANAQRYAVGDIVENFTLIDRETNQPVSLHDLEGNIVFLEWFAYWCPFCQAAAADVLEGVVQHYAPSGNINGVPVKHVALNLQSNAESQTQAFVNRYQISLVLNDFDRALANRFQTGGQPIFAIINGVENSTSHQQWQLMYSRLGYGDLNQPIETFRNIIDSVAAAPAISPPTISQQPTAQKLATGSSLALSVEAQGEELTYSWRIGDTTIDGQTGNSLNIQNLTTENAGNYSVTVSNSAGSVTSEIATIEIVLSLADYLASFNLNQDDLLAAADPDRDGYSNVLEYIAQTDPSANNSRPDAQLSLEATSQQIELSAHFPQHADAIGYTLYLQTSTGPNFLPQETQELLLPLNTPLTSPFPVTPQAGRFARIRAQASE